MVLLALLCNTTAVAQIERTSYTGNNRVVVALEGPFSRYEFTSQQMLVRYNKEAQVLECILPVETLIPLNDTIPADMAFDVLFGAKYPQLYIDIAAPVQKISAGNLTPETIRRTATIGLQGVRNNTVLPVAFTSENNSLYFSASFDLMLDNFNASLPIVYAPYLTGRILITLDRARWINMQAR